MKKITEILSFVLVVLFLIFIFLMTGCKKDQTIDALPPLTFEGKNTIGCKINGLKWVPKGIISGSVVLNATEGGYWKRFPDPTKHVRIKTNSPDYNLDLYIRNYLDTGYLKPGIYHLNKNTQTLYGYGEIHSYGYIEINSRNIFSSNKEYITDSLHTGWVQVLKSDSINKIISGRFEFDAYNSSDGKIYKITEGRFDYTNH